MGVVYHTHYLDYFEAARTEALRSLGVAYKELEDGGVIMPVVSASINYRKPSYYDDVLEIITTFPESQPVARVPILYRVMRNDEELATGSVTLCFVDKISNRPTRAPASVLDAFWIAQ